MTSAIWTIKDVAGYLRLKEKTVYALAARGEIPGFKIGGSWRFRQSDIDDWIEEKAKQAGGVIEDDD
jgi:excisionase family DNA binding protein